jgi:hypothetical protein
MHPKLTARRDQPEGSGQNSDECVDATRRAGVSATSQTLESTLADLDELFTQVTRRFDLSVVGQIEPRQGNARRNVARDRVIWVGTAGTGRTLHSESGNEA